MGDHPYHCWDQDDSPWYSGPMQPGVAQTNTPYGWDNLHCVTEQSSYRGNMREAPTARPPSSYVGSYVGHQTETLQEPLASFMHVVDDMGAPVAPVATPCECCGLSGHVIGECPYVAPEPEYEHTFSQNAHYDHYASAYNPRGMDSWGDNSYSNSYTSFSPQYPPPEYPEFYQHPTSNHWTHSQPINTQPQNFPSSDLDLIVDRIPDSLKQTLQTFMETTQNLLKSNLNSLQNMEMQVSQMTQQFHEREEGNLSCQHEDSSFDIEPPPHPQIQNTTFQSQTPSQSEGLGVSIHDHLVEDSIPIENTMDQLLYESAQDCTSSSCPVAL